MEIKRANIMNILVFFSSLLMLEVPNISYGATVNVPTLSCPTIQAGIDATNNGDTVLVANGTFAGTGNKNLDFNGKAIIVKSENGPKYTIIDCQGDGRGVDFHSDEGNNSILSGFTIVNANPTDGFGGAIAIAGSPTITNCILKLNTKGGIFCGLNSSPVITNCNITFNGGSGEIGAGIFCYINSELVPEKKTGV